MDKKNWRKRKDKDIKILDKIAVSTEKFKENLVSISKRESEETSTEYSSQELEKIYSTGGIISQYSFNKFKDKIINKKLNKDQKKKKYLKDKKVIE